MRNVRFVACALVLAAACGRGPNVEPESASAGMAPASDAGAPQGAAAPSTVGWCAPPAVALDTADAEPGEDSSCDGLMPALPQAPDFAFEAETGTHAACSPAPADAQGHVAIRWTRNAPGLGNVGSLDVFDPRGARLYSGADLEPDSGLPLRDGFVAATFAYPDQAPHLVSAHPATLDVQGSGLRLAAAPDGNGFIVVEQPFTAERRWISAHRFDAAGARVGPGRDVLETTPDRRPRLVQAALATDGRALVAWTGEPEGAPNEVRGRWLDAQGVPAGAALVLGTLAQDESFGLAPLRNGAVAMFRGEPRTWVSVVRGDAVEPPPRWLAKLADVPALRANGRGYLVPLGAPAQAGCAPRLEVRAPAGNLCGVLGLQGPADALVLGLDGTASISVAGASCGFGGCCRVRAWSGAFR